MTQVLAEPHDVPFTPWATFMASWRWRLGEHVTIVGPTGTGKTTLMRGLMQKRYDAGSAIAVLATKPRDATLETWARGDKLAVVRTWPPRPRNLFRPPADVLTPDGRRISWKHRVMLWPMEEGAELDDRDDKIAAIHKRAIHDMFWDGNWCIAAEELLVLCEDLGLSKNLRTVWTQGRSNGISLIGGTQRPVDIPLYAYSQASHLFMFGDNDDVNLARLRGIGGRNGRELQHLVRTLPWHDVLYIDARGRAPLVRTRVPVRTATKGPTA